MKTHFKQNLQIVVLAMLALIFLVVAVLEFLPSEDAGIKVKEKIKVSSSPIDSSKKDYASYLDGLLFNPGEEAIKIEKLEIVVSDGKTERTVPLSGFTLSPRSDYRLSAQWMGTVDYDRIEGIFLTVDEREVVLKNTEATFSFSALAVLATFAFGVTVILLIRASKERYYLHQEDVFLAANE